MDAAFLLGRLPLLLDLGVAPKVDPLDVVDMFSMDTSLPASRNVVLAVIVVDAEVSPAFGVDVREKSSISIESPDCALSSKTQVGVLLEVGCADLLRSHRLP